MNIWKAWAICGIWAAVCGSHVGNSDGPLFLFAVACTAFVCFS